MYVVLKEREGGGGGYKSDGGLVRGTRPAC